jgi:hypothetical protein
VTAVVLLVIFAGIPWSVWRLASHAASPAGDEDVGGRSFSTGVAAVLVGQVAGGPPETGPGVLALVDSVLVDDQDRAVILVGFRTVNDERIALVVLADRSGSAARRLVTWQADSTPVVVRGPSVSGEIHFEPSGNRQGLVVGYFPGSLPPASPTTTT